MIEFRVRHFFGERELGAKKEWLWQVRIDGNPNVKVFREFAEVQVYVKDVLQALARSENQNGPVH